jgi:quercetin dioxygenase-like cupin family protein
MAAPDKHRTDDRLLAKGGSLADLVKYQKGAVVSRTLVDKKSGTLTLFAFDQGQGLSEHTAPFDAFVYAIEGKAQVTIQGNPFELSAGDAIIMPANQPHALQATDRFIMMLVMIRA